MKLKPRKFIDNIFNIKLLGKGGFGAVIKAKLKGTRNYRAIKIIPKARVKNMSRLQNEIKIMN
jgi:calcium-dependent protein kinase